MMATLTTLSSDLDTNDSTLVTSNHSVLLMPAWGYHLAAVYLVFIAFLGITLNVMLVIIIIRDPQVLYKHSNCWQIIRASVTHIKIFDPLLIDTSADRPIVKTDGTIRRFPKKRRRWQIGVITRIDSILCKLNLKCIAHNKKKKKKKQDKKKRRQREI